MVDHITLTKEAGGSFGIGLQDYQGGTHIHVLNEGSVGAKVSLSLPN